MLKRLGNRFYESYRRFDMNPLVSIIIPIYNAERWLQECITSVINQTYHNLEIILVNDGSGDSSLQICQYFAEMDDRIVVLDKKNSGVSDTRNFGIEHTHGEYVAFLDSDDYLSPGIIETALNNIVSQKSDICQWNFKLVFDDSIRTQEEIFLNDYEKPDLLYAAVSIIRKKHCFNLGNYWRATWGKLFKTEIIKNYKIRFPVDLYMGEDAVFLCRYLLHIQKICVINEYGYFYRQIPSSSVKKYKSDLYQQSERQLQYFESILSERQDSRSFNNAMCVFTWQIFNSLIENEIKNGSSKCNDGKKWARSNRKYMRYSCFGIQTSKLIKLQIFFHFLPISCHCKLVCAYFRKKM